MGDQIQSKWDEFRQKEEEYLKLNDEIEERRKHISHKIKVT